MSPRGPFGREKQAAYQERARLQGEVARSAAGAGIPERVGREPSAEVHSQGRTADQALAGSLRARAGEVGER